MWAWCKRTGLIWRCQLPGGVTIELTEGILDALRVIPRNGTPLQKIEALRPLIHKGTINREQLKAMWRGGYLKSKYPRKELAKNLGENAFTGWNKTAHHDYPITRELDFILAGIDINAGSSTGRWLPKELHSVIHDAPGWPTSGRGGPWHYQSERFFDEFDQLGTSATRAEIEAFRDRLRAVTSDVSKSVEEIQWPYPKS